MVVVPSGLFDLTLRTFFIEHFSCVSKDADIS